jgi:hypothetical protein
MNIEFLREWADALESGKYKQGTGYLRDIEDQYCCLGVACDLLIEKHVLDSWQHDSASAYSVHSRASSLPDIAAHYIGFEGDNANYGPLFYHNVPHLVAANDDRRYSFSQIASILRNVANQEEEWTNE